MTEAGWTVRDIREGWAYLRNDAYVYVVPLRFLPERVKPGEEVYTDGLTIWGYLVFGRASAWFRRTAAGAA